MIPIQKKTKRMQKTTAKQNTIREAAMFKDAVQALLNSGDLLSTNDICQLASLTTNTQLIQWVKDQKIFSVHLDNIEYYPAYIFDAGNGYQPLKAINEIIKIFGKKYDGLRLAIWFNVANSYLAGKYPQDMISQNPDLVIHAAKIQIEGIQHG